MYSLAGCKDVDWYVGIAVFENSAQNLGRILQQSVSDELLIAALKATNAVLASCALVEEENAKTTLSLKPWPQSSLFRSCAMASIAASCDSCAMIKLADE